METEDRVGEDIGSHQELFLLMEGASPEIWNGVMELEANLETIRLATKTEAPVNVDISLAQMKAVKYLLAKSQGLSTQGMHLALQNLGENSVSLHPLNGGNIAQGYLQGRDFVVTQTGQADRHYPLHLPPEPEDRVLHAPQARVLTPHAASVQLEGLIERHLEKLSGAAKEHTLPLIESVTGLSGSGKSTLTKEVADQLLEHGIGVRMIEGDSGIGTERGTLRDKKDQLPAPLPEELYALRQQTLLALLYVGASEGRAIRIGMPRMYQRNQGTSMLGKGVLSFPKVKQNTHVILLEGSDATGMVPEVAILEQLLGLPPQTEHLVAVLPSSLSSAREQFAVAIERALKRAGGPNSNDGSPWDGEGRTWQKGILQAATQRAEAVVVP